MVLSETDGYYRVSSTRQRDEGHALERYRDDLIRAGVPEDRIFFDVESGASLSREGYNTIRDRIRQGITKRVLVPCFDRFTRSPLGWEQCIEEFKQYGARLDLISGGIVDLTTPEGIYKSRLDAAAAAYVREKNAYNAARGWEYRRKQGKASSPPFGYLVEGDRYIPNDNPYRDTGLTVAEMSVSCAELFTRVGTVRSTLRQLIQQHGRDRCGSAWWEDFPRDRNKFSTWLQNPVLRGYRRYFGNRGKAAIVQPGDHEALFSPTLAADIDRCLAASREGRTKRGQSATYSCSGLIFCECGSRTIMGGGDTARYYCADHTEYYGTKQCGRSGGLTASDAELAAILAIRAKAEEWADLILAATPIEPMEEPPELQELRRKMLILGDDPDFQIAKDAIARKIESLEAELALRSDTFDIDREALITTAQEYATWENVTADAKRFAFRRLIRHIVKRDREVIRVEFVGSLGQVNFLCDNLD